QGSGNVFFRVRGTKKLTVDTGALNNAFYSTAFHDITLNTGANFNFFSNNLYDGTLVDNGGNTTFLYSYKLSPGLGPAMKAEASPTVGASPYSYVNTTGNTQYVQINGGTVSAVDLNHNGATRSLCSAANCASAAGNGAYIVGFNDTLIITYS